MMENRMEKRNIILSQQILTNVFALDSEVANTSFNEIGSLKQIIKKLQDKVYIPGFRPLEECVSMLLGYIFETGNKTNHLDLYCTHDLQLAMLNSAFFCPTSSIKKINSDWPNMLEGMFLWGNRKDFYCVWRGKIVHLVDFMT